MEASADRHHPCCVLPVPAQGKLCWVIQCLIAFLGYKNTVKSLCDAPTIEDQRK